jgi:putative spermidine/putrescine transport system permease protein
MAGIERPGAAKAKLSTLRAATAPFLLVSPILIILLTFVLFLVGMIANSLATGTEHSGLTLANYGRILTSSFFYLRLVLSAKLALLSTLFSLLLGYPVALYMTRVSGVMLKVIFLFLTVLFFSDYVMRMYAVILAFGNNGFVNQTLLGIGAIMAPIHFLYSQSGVVIGLVAGNLAFMIFALYPTLSRINPDYAAAASLLGASPLRQFMLVTLPLSAPGVVAGCSLVFLMSLNSYITPALLGAGFVQMIANLIFDQAISTWRLPLASASATVLLFVTLITLVGVGSVTRLYATRSGR